MYGSFSQDIAVINAADALGDGRISIEDDASLPLFPWPQNLVTQRSPRITAVFLPREGSITCTSTPTVNHGVTAKL
jgi:hypothetical protein